MASILLIIGAGSPVLAGEQSYPFISGDVAFELQNDWTYDSEDSANEQNDLFTKIEPTVVMHFMKGLTLTAHGVFEPVRDPEAGKDRTFGDHGFFIQDLFGQY